MELPLAAPVKAPPARSHRRLVLSMGVLFAGAIAISFFRLLATEISLERYYVVRSNGGGVVVAVKEAAKGSLAPYFDESLGDGDLQSDYECVAWRRTGGGSPDGQREPDKDANCSTTIAQGVSGYCEYRRKSDGMIRRVLPVYDDTLYRSALFECEQAGEFMAYGPKSLTYVHDDKFSLTKNQDLVRAELRQKGRESVSFERGVTMVIHGGVLASAYVSIRSLRDLGMTLPVEMWYKPNEVDVNHPLLQDLEKKYNVIVREMKDEHATKYYTKLYAVFYSAFDSVLLLDADNFAVKNPSYLFDTKEFQDNGAMFWPDFWQPRQTTFNVQPHSLVWRIFGIEFVDMFEQESGQVLIDRRRHQKALNMLMYYGFSMPRVHERLQLAWGDKDLFRFAWLKTNSSFHYITRHAGSAGRLNRETRRFCGVTMVQHDPQGEIIFLHRNMAKMQAGTGNKLVWTHIEQFKLDSPKEKYSMGFDKVFEDIPGCWANSADWKPYYSMVPIHRFEFQNLESRLLALAEEAAEVEYSYAHPNDAE